MSSVNNVTLLGYIGNDPEIKQTSLGRKTARFSLATSKTWNDPKTGERKEKTTWHNIRLFAGLAEFAGNYLKKGSRVYIHGELNHYEYQDKDGNTKTVVEVVASELVNLTPKLTDKEAFGDKEQKSRGRQTAKNAKDKEKQVKTGFGSVPQPQEEMNPTFYEEEDIPF